MTARKTSFGEKPKSLLDKIIQLFRMRKLEGMIPDGSTILDLGCGYKGEMLSQIEEKIKSGVGIDLSVDHKFKSEKIKLRAGKVDEKIPFENNLFDVVTALAIIEHVDHPEVMLAEIYRVLKKNGKLILTTPSLFGKWPLEIMAAMHIISHEEIADHKRYYETWSLRKALVRAGFDQRRIHIKHFGINYLNLMAETTK